jgi:hypothetical protein
VGLQQIDIVRAERDALARQRAQAEAQLAEQRSHVADFAVRSPIDGRVLTRTVERGERVDAGTPLFTLVDLDRLYVKIYVPEPSIGKVALGQEARVVDAYPGRAFRPRWACRRRRSSRRRTSRRRRGASSWCCGRVALGENPAACPSPDARRRGDPLAAQRRGGERRGRRHRSEPVPELPAGSHPGGVDVSFSAAAGLRLIRPTVPLDQRAQVLAGVLGDSADPRGRRGRDPDRRR